MQHGLHVAGVGDSTRELGGGRVACDGIFCQGAQDNARKRLWNIRIDQAGGSGEAFDMLHHDRDGAFVAKRHDAGTQFVENHAERVDIAAGIGGMALGLFGRHVGGGVRGMVITDDLRDAEIREQWFAQTGVCTRRLQQENIAWCNVAVHHTMFVGVVDRGPKGGEEVDDF